ncbi:MAG: uracil-DNA glycosylase [Rhodoplanes sp.]|uniref:uracil-DNA glycosylase n=1 Tax=Rhodoplanes sp. TaxID=1968906 RepID=UPI00180741BF|nr:uracil-DNA glycosylase [Rhodoplanes sp.]NVO13976.1 uracil-DNA glycosylase [Rhodoplanes sp.]
MGPAVPGPSGAATRGAEPALGPEPRGDCPRCPRLVEFRETWRSRKPEWCNAPVPSFGPSDARLLIVGLAPGLQGANRTGRPFTGDYAGDLLYATLLDFGFARGTYAARPDDGLTLLDARITNAVRCVPPENKPTGPEIATCRPFLIATMAEMPRLAAVVALGRVAHDTMITTLGRKKSACPFGHGAVHPCGDLTVFDSYHCSRYNTNTGVLTEKMFRDVFTAVRAHLDAASHSSTAAALRSGGKTG